MNRIYGNVIIFLFVSLAVTSCGSRNPKEEPLPDISPITVGYLPILGYSPFFIAFEKGYFEEQGLDVELVSFRSGSFMMPLFATGDLDIGGGQPGTEYFNAAHQELDITLTAGFSNHPKGHGTTPFLVRTDLFESGEITQPSDLEGAKVAINVERGIVEFFAAEVLSLGGLELDDVEIVTMPFPDMNVALANQAIDAALVPQPLAASAIRDGSAVILIDSDEFSENAQAGVIYFGKRMIEPPNHEVGVRFFVAFLKAVRELQGEDGYNDENLEILSRYTNVPDSAIRAGVKNYFGLNGEINYTFLEEIMIYFLENEYTEFSEPLILEQIIDTSFLDDALERIGIIDE